MDSKLQEEINNMPLADDDPSLIIEDNDTSQSSDCNMRRSIDSIDSEFTNESASPSRNSNYEPDISTDELEEKSRFITQVLELQNTLDDLSQRVDSVKDENLKLRAENQVLGQYIENLMSASSVFQTTSPKPKK